MGEPVEQGTAALRLSKAAQWLQPCPDIEIGGTSAQLLGGEDRARAATNRGLCTWLNGEIAAVTRRSSMLQNCSYRTFDFLASGMRSCACTVPTTASLTCLRATAA
jgi:hypothetical protein